MGKINKPVVNGVSNRFYYKGSEYDVRQTSLGLQLYRNNRFYQNILTSSSEEISFENIITDIEGLKENEYIYQIYTYVGTATSGQVTVPSESSIYDFYGDGIIDAIVVAADENQLPKEENSYNSSGEIVTVSTLLQNGNYTLDSTPVGNSCIIYYVKIQSQYLDNIDQNIIVAPGVPLSQTPFASIIVAKSNGDYTDIKEANDSITDSSSSKRYTIQVAPGTYIVDNSAGPVELNSFVTIESIGIRSVVFTPLDPTKSMFKLSGANTFSYVKGFIFSGLTDANAYAIENAGSGALNVWDCAIRDCSNGILNSSTGTTEIKTYVVNNPASTTTISGIKCTNGKLSMIDITARGDAICNKLLDISGVGVQTKVTDITSISPNVGVVAEVYNGASLTGGNINIQGSVDGIVAYGTDTELELGELKMFFVQRDGFRIENVGANIIFSLFSGVILNSGRFNFNVENPNCTVTGSGYTEINKSFIDPNCGFYAYLLDLTEGDEGLNILGELRVGTSLRPAEAIFGAGDSHVFEYIYTKTPENVFTDRTVEAISASNSTFPAFDDVTIGNALYVANRHPITFEGIKILIDTASVQNYGDIVAEYWNGSSWVEVNGCVSQSGPGFSKFRKQYFEQVGSFHIKFDPFIRDLWQQNDPAGLGTDYYWLRFRVVNNIATVPILQQIKIHTDRTEFNTDGTQEQHMDARVYKKLTVDAVKPIEGSMQDASIYVDENVGIGLDNNRFTTVGDLLGISFELPEDCDTSAPIIFVWKGKFDTTGNVDFTVRRKIVNPKAAYTNGEPAPSGEVITVTTGSISIDAANQRRDFRVNLDISDAIPSRSGGADPFENFGDEIWITLQYPTRGAGNFDYTKLSANYLSDFNGRHIRQ